MGNRGWYELLLQVMEQESQRQHADFGSATASASRDPNFRQLSQAPFVESLQGTMDAYGRPGTQSGTSPSPGGSSVFELAASPAFSAGLDDSYAPKSRRMVIPPLMTPVPIGFRGMPSTMRQPRMPPQPGIGQTDPLPIPMPPIPEPWKMLGATMGLLPELFRERYGGGGGGGRGRDNARDDGEEENFCDARHDKERRRCFRRYTDLADQKLHLPGCLKNAEERKNSCYANGGHASLNEPDLWGPEHEEIWRNYGR